MALVEREGGCQCGAVRFSTRVDPATAYLCHCRMCQKATGGVSIAFVGVAIADIGWTREPNWYRSSPFAQRPFCKACGTPLGFSYDDGETMDLTIGSFDDRSGFVPQHHFGAENIMEAWLDTTKLERVRTDQHAKLVDKWMAATGALPE